MADETKVQIRPILLTWERLRVLYNLVLTGVTMAGLALRPDNLLSERWFPFFLIYCWIGANICFCAGPFFEAYINYLANRRIHLTWWLFFPGMLLSILLALVLSMTWGLGDFF